MQSVSDLIHAEEKYIRFQLDNSAYYVIKSAELMSNINEQVASSICFNFHFLNSRIRGYLNIYKPKH